MRSRAAVRLAGLVLVAGAGPVAAGTASPVYLGANGEPLPIQSDEEIVELLLTGRQISSKTLSQGITQARKLRLANEGVEVNAVFHHIDSSERKVKRLPNGRVVGYLRDSYTGQVAAYELSRLLHMDNVPPTTRRLSDGLNGSVQLWIESAMTEEDRQDKGIEPPDYTVWNQLYADMRVFDNLINNIDRNLGNMLVDAQGNLWLIDHTRTFGRDKVLPHPETVTRCSRRLFAALQGLPESALRERLSALLAAGEIQSLLQRRSLLIELIERRIAELGEDVVLFDYGDPEPSIRVRYEEDGE